MSRVIAAVACGFALAACSMSMPSFDMFKSSPSMETLRLESEPPGADARTAQGQSCRTPCELAVPAGQEVAISFALAGYQPQTIPVHNDLPPGVTDPAIMTRLQPNPVYAELKPMTPQRGQKKAAPKKKAVARNSSPQQPAASQVGFPDPNSAYPTGFPWPDPAPR
jgi:hypothetical protein